MGLIARIRRWRYVYGWRLRYWWLDTPSGLHTRLGLAVVCSLLVIGNAIALAVKVATPPPKDQPQHAVVWFVVWAVIILVSAIIGFLLAAGGAKQQPTAPQGDTPTTDDGQSVRDYFGTCWVDDSFLLAWKLMGRSPIKSKGGK